ncbi:MAG: septum formation initiator family protein [Desulfobacteraceae bacterium]
MDVSKKSIIKFALLSLLFLGLIMAWLSFGQRGFIHLYRMEKKRQANLERIQKLERENQELLEEIKRLREDMAYIESLGRRELGLIKEDEILYRFIRDKALSEPPSATEESGQ